MGMSKSFGKGRDASLIFKDLTLDLGRGEVLAICGRSGVGKTTVLRIIAGLENPDAGEVLIDGKRPFEHYPRIGMVSQDYTSSLLPWLSSRANITLALRTSVPSKLVRESIADRWIAEMGLSNLGTKRPWQLSGGMRQRVAIARALATEPILLCLDEPFASLDTQMREELQDVVLDLKEKYNISVVLVTHDLDEALYMADKILVISSQGDFHTFDAPFGWPREQGSTRSDPRFPKLRTELVKATK